MYVTANVLYTCCCVSYSAYIHVTLDHYPKKQEDLYCKYTHTHTAETANFSLRMIFDITSLPPSHS